MNAYRSVHTPAPLHRAESKIGAPWLLLSEQDIADFLIANPGVTTRSEPIMRMLAWLDREFSISDAHR